MTRGEPRTHYNNALRPDLYAVPACGVRVRSENGLQKNSKLKTTVDIDLVTCGRCLKVLRRNIHSQQ